MSGSQPPASVARASSFTQGESNESARRGRRSNPKVRTGCTNCKARRIKCDELRPACSQCVKSKKTCTGYPPPARGDVSFIDVRIAPKPVLALRPQTKGPIITPMGITNATVLPPRRASRGKRRAWAAQQAQVTQRALDVASSPTIQQPLSTLPLQQDEGLYFQLFREQTASQMSGYFNSTFWAQCVLQECHAETAIRHAVVALGALYKTLEQTFYLPTMPPERRDMHISSLVRHWQVAFKQYSEAVKSTLLLNGQSLRAYRTRLMASILLACFDSFVGDHKPAILQIQSGLRMLEHLQSQYPDHRVPRPEGYIEDELLNIFTRLAIQAKSYDMAFHFPQPYVIQLAPPQPPSPGSSPPSSDIGSPGSPSSIVIPIYFETLLDARLASDKLCTRLLKFIERLQIAKNNTSNVLPASWREFGIELKAELDAWSRAFEHIFQSRLNPQLSHIEKAGISALKMFQINSDVLFLMMFCDTEVHFDAFYPHFKNIVSLGWEVVAAEERKAAAEMCRNPENCQHSQHVDSQGAFTAGQFNPSHIKPSFSADLGIVPPLYVVATKCREPNLRRQAIQLLRSSARREGMWDSELAANIGDWVMRIEELDETMPVLQHQVARPIPEERRVMVKSVDFNLRSRSAYLRVGTRAVHEGQADSRVKTTRITW
ncbi:hypothetical protein QQS21_009279 [Conoideocrella luteorostrata]|uniref:Zn(2)-C6 fungal-type domain-containing protein n=1 Tax=Conoideocrella luteorostrata TaxID=1105319 RepID=A0AAJ0FXX9_9HYPO|nr:hypothetical protein QQS21_009279 [Conoideocrella luteorostrata]